MTDTGELLTLLLPLRGREAFTLRLMEYLDRSRFPFRLMIADGSSGPASDVLSSPENFPNVRYTYKKYPFDATYSVYYRKMASALSEIDTPYTAMIDNDCIPVAEGLQASLLFLESHSGYSTCRGQHIDFQLSSAPDDGGEPLYGSEILIPSVYFDRGHTIWRSFEGQSPIERILDWSHCTNIMYFNVHRTEVLQDAWSFISRNDLCDLFCTDLAVVLNGIVHGKSKVIDTPFTMRQQNSPGGVSREVTRSLDILDRMFVEKWTKDINRLIEHIAASAADGMERAMSEVVPEVRLAIKNHYADRLYSHLERRHRARMESDMPTVELRQNGPDIRISGSARSQAVDPVVDGIMEFLLGHGSV